MFNLVNLCSTLTFVFLYAVLGFYPYVCSIFMSSSPFISLFIFSPLLFYSSSNPNKFCFFPFKHIFYSHFYNAPHTHRFTFPFSPPFILFLPPFVTLSNYIFILFLPPFVTLSNYIFILFLPPFVTLSNYIFILFLPPFVTLSNYICYTLPCTFRYPIKLYFRRSPRSLFNHFLLLM